MSVTVAITSTNLCISVAKVHIVYILCEYCANGVKWSLTGPNGAKYSQTGLIEVKCGQTGPNLVKQVQMGPNVAIRSQIWSNRFKFIISLLLTLNTYHFYFISYLLPYLVSYLLNLLYLIPYLLSLITPHSFPICFLFSLMPYPSFSFPLCPIPYIKPYQKALHQIGYKEWIVLYIHTDMNIEQFIEFIDVLLKLKK